MVLRQETTHRNAKNYKTLKKTYRLDTIKLIKFRIVKDNFQRKLKEDISIIKSSPDVYVFADKTTNIYKLPSQDYKKLLHEISPNPIKNHQPVWKNL